MKRLTTRNLGARGIPRGARHAKALPGHPGRCHWIPMAGRPA
jgi:hypothetical protein